MDLNIDGLDDFNSKYQGYFDEDEIERMDRKLKKEGKAGMVYDPSGGLGDDLPPPNLPNVDELLDGIIQILQYMCTDEMKKLKDDDEGEYKRHMEEKFPDFSFRYYATFQKVISGDDLTHLFNMIGAMKSAESGRMSFEQAEKSTFETLKREYIYPKFPNSRPTKNNKKKRKKH